MYVCVLLWVIFSVLLPCCYFRLKLSFVASSVKLFQLQDRDHSSLLVFIKPLVLFRFEVCPVYSNFWFMWLDHSLEWELLEGRVQGWVRGRTGREDRLEGWTSWKGGWASKWAIGMTFHTWLFSENEFLGPQHSSMTFLGKPPESVCSKCYEMAEKSVGFSWQVLTLHS